MASTSKPPSTRPHLDEETIDIAMEWYLRLKDDSATQEDRLAFRQWLDRDERHAMAYADAGALWQDVEAPACLWVKRERHREHQRHTRAVRRRRPWVAVACALLLALFVSAGLWRDPGMPDRMMADVSTVPGQSHEMRLADGSWLFLDADSALDIDMARDMRELTLRRGRLWVDVLSEDARPFHVVAGDALVKVVGTRFAVERDGEQVKVTVEEGRVAVSGDRSPENAESIVLDAGQQIVVSDGMLGVPSDIDAWVQFAWRRGQVVFDQAGIAEVVAQLERMLPGRVLFDGDRLGSLRLSGSFPGDDPTALLDALDSALGVEVRRVPGGLVWLRLPGDA
ncbi:FecR family protein [Billgrantia endophytica]|uniref:FecR family protein n=1 Tax=Billgrantia endophytica TaxID=2033802 RepID=UPI0013FDF4E5|nr:FecR domain-containing protein [Halomonas endophytica]